MIGDATPPVGSVDRPHQRTPRRGGSRRAGPLRLGPVHRLWPLAALCLGMPIWFLLGAAAAVWALPGLVLGMDLLRRRRFLVPRGAGLLAALLGWIALSVIQVRGVEALALFSYRWTLFASMAALYVWLCDAGERRASSATVIKLLAVLWLVLVVFGWAALALPDFVVASPVQRLLPGALRADPFLQELTNIEFAETQSFLGYVVPRPAAPLAFANGWGSTLGLLTPFFLLAWLVEAPKRWRRVGAVVLVLALVPVVVSLNRGLWLSVAVALAYVAGRKLLAGDARTTAHIVVSAVVVVAGTTLTPLWDVANDKVTGAEDGDATRALVYEEALDQSLRSPLLGHGAPVQVEGVPVTVGTHGLVWYLLVSHGLPAAALFLLWLGGVVRRGLALRSVRGMWCTAAAVVGAFQVPIYGLLPQLVVLGAVAALIWREHEVVRREAGVGVADTAQRMLVTT